MGDARLSSCHFSLNLDLLARARSVLAGRKDVFWITGGACAGKTTVCRSLAAAYGLAIYDVDDRTFNAYPDRCTSTHHPALKTWFSAPDPFAWMLGLSPEHFLAFNQAANAEILDLFSDDLAQIPVGEGLLIDGGITNPSLLAQVAPLQQIVCLKTTPALSRLAWEESPSRRFMKDMVFQQPNPEAAWEKFLLLDRLMTETILRECRESGIRIFQRDRRTPAEAFMRRITRYIFSA